MIALFDSNIVIDALNGRLEADQEFRRFPRVLISQITWMEVLVGVHGDDSLIRDFLRKSFEIIPVDGSIAEETILIRRAFRLRLPDAIIWATARVNDAMLVTRNTRDFNAELPGIRMPYAL